MAGGANDGLYTYDLALADGGPRVIDVVPTYRGEGKCFL